MISNTLLRAAILVVAAVLGNTISTSVGFAESYDKPARETVVNLGRSQYLLPDNTSRIQLSCSYYPSFMVKQLNDPGQKGTQWVTVDSVLDGHFPACSKSHSPTERFVAEDGWFFTGVKGSLLFFEAPDGSSGGMPFRILDLKTGKKIFEDSVWWKSHLEFSRAPEGNIALTYLRLVEGDCSIPKGGISCWNKLRSQFGLVLDTVPKCAGYRREGEREWVVGDLGVPPEAITTESAIAYPVVVKLFPQPSIKAVPGEVTCRPI